MIDLGWQLDNPAEALEKYYIDAGAFAIKGAVRDDKKRKLSVQKADLEAKQAELQDIRDRLSSMESYEPGDTAGAIQKTRDKAQSAIEDEIKSYEAKRSELADKRDSDIRDNDGWLSDRLSQLVGDDADANRELTDVEEKALAFEFERRKFIEESNERINGYEDAITEEQLACRTMVGNWRGEQDAIYSKYEANIAGYKREIASIEKKYQPDIRKYQADVTEKASDRDREINRLQDEKNREIQQANERIEEYKKDFDREKRVSNESIRMAKFQNKPTTRMETNRDSRLNRINDDIVKTKNRAEKKASSINKEMEEVREKYAKRIEKAEKQLNEVIRKREQELEAPTRAYNDLVEERDRQIASLQSKIDQRESECNTKVSEKTSNIESEKKDQNDHNIRVDQQIVDLVMSGDSCFSDILDEQKAPFAALESRVNTWMEMLFMIKKERLSLEYPEEHEKQKRILASKDYSALWTELTEATGFRDQLSLFAKHTGRLSIVSGELMALGVILFVVFSVILKVSIGSAGIVFLAAGIALMVLTTIKTNTEFSRICRYVSLASDYREFPGIASRSAEITRDRELARMKELGDKLYDIYYGKAEAQRIHDAKDADIKADYERDLKLLTTECENKKAEIERACRRKLERINEEAVEGEEKFNNEKEELRGRAGELLEKIDELNTGVHKLEREIDEDDRFMNAFENNYREFEKKLDDISWVAPMNYTRGKLGECLYIIPEGSREVDDYNHRRIYEIRHKKKAFVVNYDITGVEYGRIEEVNKIIHDLMFDLMYAVYRVNSKGIYEQYVVDGMSATNELKNKDVKNTFAIREVVGKLEEIRGRIKSFSEQKEELAEKGITMDALNEKNFQEQDRPRVYNILYIIFKPDEKKSRLDDEIRALLPGCEKYGFLPIFICEKETWERESQEKESVYKDIKGLANSNIVVFDGKRYYVERGIEMEER